MSFELSIEAEPGRSVSAILSASNPRVFVGRKKTNALATTHRTVSREHAEFLWEDGVLWVRDLDSTAGTFINGKRVQRAVIELGDTVTCGKLEVHVRAQRDDGVGPAETGGGTAVLGAFDPSDELEPRLSAQGGAENRPSTPEPDVATTDPTPHGATAVSQVSPTDRVEPVAETPQSVLVFSFFDSDGTTGSFELSPDSGDIVVGRGKAATVRVKHRTVSRTHCSIAWKDGKAQVTDLQSSAGTYFKGRKIRRKIVGAGDMIAAGKLEITVSVAEGGAKRTAPAAQAGPWTIVHKDIEGGEHRHEIGPGSAPITIGRGKAATIRVPESTAGRKHCEVSYVNGALVVRDLDSRNGTFVNDVKVKRHTLEPGDTLKCGSFPLAILGPQRVGGIEGWEENWDDDWTDVNEMTPPSWHLLYRTDEGLVDNESLDPEMRILAVGSDPDCEICVQDRGVEPDHCEITWEEGVLVATDLNSEIGTLVRDKPIDEKVLKNGDIIVVSDFRLHVVRGAAQSAPSKSTKGKGSVEARTWAERFEEKDSSLCLVYCYGDEEDPSFPDIGKVELTLWADGEARVEVVTQQRHVRGTGRVHEGVVTLLFEALTHAGYPTVPATAGEDGACPVEISLYQDDYEVTSLISHKNMNRIEPYREAIELLRAIAYELECTAEDV
ncbi:MAG: FHA domain-containing protein [Myxococcota bacterium]|nr:FHA domain-containing protein [Myxococcota bacterium]